MKRWLKQHQHAALIRPLLACAQRGYELAWGGRERPAIAGGRPQRWVPFPAPKPFSWRDRREVRRVLRAQNTSFFDGGAVARFERALERRFGARHAIAVSSGTAALHAALLAAEVGPGDEVCVPVCTYVSTALAVLYAGASVRFVDVHPDTWTLDPGQLERAVGPRTKAVIAVHLGGVPCDLRAIEALCTRRGLTLVEDAAQAHGARHDGRAVGTCGALGCFSFGTTKIVCTGEGGALVTDDDELAQRARLAMNVGELSAAGRPSLDEADFDPAAPLNYDTLGWNYRMSAAQAAVGVGQVERLETLRAHRAANAARLEARLDELGVFRRQAVPAGGEPCWWNLFVTLDEGPGIPSRDDLLRGLAHERVDYVVPYRAPLSSHPLFGAGGGRFPEAERFCRQGIGFRVDPALGAREMDAVGAALRRLLAWFSRGQTHNGSSLRAR